MAEWDRSSCMQSGPRGPPFAPYVYVPLGIFNWLPSRWYSLTGTGWCYRADWDELVRCAETLASPDWNGVVHAGSASASMPWLLCLLMALTFTAALALHGVYAERRRSKHVAAQSGEISERGYTMRAWLMHADVVSWAQAPNVWWAGGGALLGFIVALLLPL